MSTGSFYWYFTWLFEKPSLSNVRTLPLLCRNMTHLTAATYYGKNISTNCGKYIEDNMEDEQILLIGVRFPKLKTNQQIMFFQKSVDDTINTCLVSMKSGKEIEIPDKSMLRGAIDIIESYADLNDVTSLSYKHYTNKNMKGIIFLRNISFTAGLKNYSFLIYNYNLLINFFKASC